MLSVCNLLFVFFLDALDFKPVLLASFTRSMKLNKPKREFDDSRD